MPSTDEHVTRPLWGLKRVRAADLFDAWLFAEVEASLALAAWRSAPSECKSDAYNVYVAAVDREARAADVLAIRLGAARA
jgi:hypothetical protein